VRASPSPVELTSLDIGQSEMVGWARPWPLHPWFGHGRVILKIARGGIAFVQKVGTLSADSWWTLHAG